jgi:hypothetical protein
MLDCSCGIIKAVCDLNGQSSLKLALPGFFCVRSINLKVFTLHLVLRAHGCICLVFSESHQQNQCVSVSFKVLRSHAVHKPSQHLRV